MPEPCEILSEAVDIAPFCIHLPIDAIELAPETDMTARALEFIQLWIKENLAREPSSDHLETADTLTLRCLDEAEAKGIRESEIQEEIGDLRSFIKEALESTADEEGDDEDTV